MTYLNMYKHSTTLLASIALLIGLNADAMSQTNAGNGPSSAAKLSAELGKDFSKPIKIASGSQFVDAKKKTSILEHDVVITQGSLTINADYLKVDGTGGKGSEKFIASGAPARYVQTLEDGSKVSATANNIEYDVATRTIKLSGKAELVQNTSTVKGDAITFDMVKEQMLANSDANSNTRVETVFSPDAVKPKLPANKPKENQR